jgi:hypothetical protein
MNCDDFKAWLLDKDEHDQVNDQEAAAHRTACAGCNSLYALDTHLEAQLKNALAAVNPPVALYASLEKNIRTADNV